MYDDPRPLDRPLVVIGGFFNPFVPPSFLTGHFRRMAGSNVDIVSVSLGLSGSMSECRGRVLDAVERAYPSDDPHWTVAVDVVGASLGGLVARYAAAPSDNPAHPRRLKIVRLFSVSSPQQGSTLASAIGFTRFHRDLRPRSEFMRALAAQDAGAGYEVYPYVLLRDGIVGARYTAPLGRKS